MSNLTPITTANDSETATAAEGEHTRTQVGMCTLASKIYQIFKDHTSIQALA